MPPAAALIFLTVAMDLGAFAQITFGPPSEHSTTPASPGWPLGRPHTRVTLNGLAICSDGTTLSIELADQRVIRFQLDEKTRYSRDTKPGSLASFHMADFVQVESEVDNKGFLLAHSVRFVREAAPSEMAEVFQSPELMQRWQANVLGASDLHPTEDDRALHLVSKPEPIRGFGPDGATGSRPSGLLGAIPPEAETSPAADDELISLTRQWVNDSFKKLPNFRAKQITSMFKSISKPVKWIPEEFVTAEVAYEDDGESYSDLHVGGKRLANAPAAADAAYMRSLDKAWSTGDFKTISHCVFSELPDSDFRKAGTEDFHGERLVRYEFAGPRSSSCIGVNFKSQITYPAYNGSMKVRARTGEILHVEMEASGIPAAFPLDRAERSIDFESVRIGSAQYLLPATAYWFGCFRSSYSCFLNRIDFRDYRRFEADSKVSFGNLPANHQ